MNIIIDLTVIRNKKQITGIERVAIESTKQLLTYLKNKSYKVFILCSKMGFEIAKDELTNIKDFEKLIFKKSPFFNRIATDQIWLPLIINKLKPKFVYFTTLGVPLFNRYPFYFIIHDAVAWAMPETTSKGMKLYYKPLIAFAVKKKNLKKIFTVSHFSKKEIIKYLHVDNEKIAVNYLGVKKIPVTEIKLVTNVSNKGCMDYIVTLGTLEPRKNLQNLINAFAILKSRYNYKGKLVVIGRKGWSGDLNIQDENNGNIVFTGFLEEKKMLDVLKKAKVYVFPSLYEGFGLPLIEAMALGVPIASSNQASLPEIGGNACLYFDPYKPEDMAEKINELLNSDSKREELKKKGFEIVKKYTWDAHRKTLISTMFEE
ncbi:glycosyltransferase family 4 protein [Heyndrickxia coagulans]|uniref:glycosyltransferase family 4 protein n=1 Tax=Heyndrickxia coagulans TaxID=1398 RepID=UPI000304ABB5|nr:glycosyltransferase family 1 protein [Heyndrickxia coagulans]